MVKITVCHHPYWRFVLVDGKWKKQCCRCERTKEVDE